MSYSRKHRLDLAIEPEQKKSLLALRKKNQVPIAVMVRKGVQLAINYYEEREELIEEALNAADR